MDAKTARRMAQVALQFLSEAQLEPQMTDARVEEIETSGDGSEWYVTVSYARPLPSYTAEAQLAKILPSAVLTGRDTPMERDFKRVTIKANSGEVVSVARRELV